MSTTLSTTPEEHPGTSRPSRVRLRHWLSCCFFSTPVLYAAFAAALVLEQPGSEEQHFQGAVFVLHDSKLYVIGDDRESYIFHIDSKTTVTIDGVPSKADDLKSGQPVNVLARGDDSRRVATWIDAYAKGRPVARSPSQQGVQLAHIRGESL